VPVARSRTFRLVEHVAVIDHEGTTVGRPPTTRPSSLACLTVIGLISATMANRAERRLTTSLLLALCRFVRLAI
jgi:hypothetical protein